jgi:signal transduction histidine kinase
MNEDLNNSQLEILSHFAKITSISSLDQLLDIVMEETPRLLHSAGCSVYLIPDLVPQYDGTLLEKDGTTIKVDKVQQDFVVLAATSRPDTDELVGKAFYLRGYGLSGWVFEHGKSLRLEDMHDQEELHDIDPRLCWSDRYGGSKDYYSSGDRKPILIVPLIADARTLGILKVPATMDKRPFTQTAEQIATIIAQIIAGVIRHTWIVQEQGRTIYRLVEISAKEELQEVFESVTESLAEILNCTRCQLYLRNEDGSLVELVVENGKRPDAEHPITYERGEDLIGWVFRTGKPLIIDDVREYAQGRRLDDSFLQDISDDRYVNEEDRFLTSKRVCATQDPDRKLSFLAVPVKATDGSAQGVYGSVQGVLCADQIDASSDKRATPFGRNELQLARSFASTILVVIDNERERRLGNLLTRLGFYWDPEKLFELVVEEIPKLVSGSGCCIYTLEQGAEGPLLQLVKSSRRGLLGLDGELAKITYDVGEGKTGFCALSEATLVVNHYGAGQVARQAMGAEKRRIIFNYLQDLVQDLRDENGRQVGVIQLRRGAKASPEAQTEFKRLSRSLRTIQGLGLPSPKLDQYTELCCSPSWSFVAVPIKSESSDLYGVITMGRLVGRNPFSPSEITLLESIARTLATVMLNLRMQEQREQLLQTLAHEINTPLTGILADTENLMYELEAGSEPRALSKHNLEQVLRLHLLTETIMAVMSGQTPARAFSVHSIYRPIKSACELFESEAAQKGCNILPPRAIGSRFPDIEMSLFDLTLAFKNLIHNAVKYSFGSSRVQQRSRYVRIVGHWADSQNLRYSISIQNYGIGISKEEIEKRLIFNPYYRGERASDRRRTGAGLGLAHARQIIEDLHHGSIEVTSRPMPGEANPYLTTFTVTLPVRQPCPDR